MQIAIDIRDEIYEVMHKDVPCSGVWAEIRDAIVAGTPLPKGHGRLIDADKIDNITAVRDKYGRLKCIDAPTLIEADKGEKTMEKIMDKTVWDKAFGAIGWKEVKNADEAIRQAADNVEYDGVYHCLYCGVEIIKEKNNPSDEGLHMIPAIHKNKYSACCEYCNAITLINRDFKRIIRNPETFNDCIADIERVIEKLKKDKDNVKSHYLMAENYRRVMDMDMKY